MALIKINIADSLLSESAAKKPGYKMAKVGGASALVISSEHKPAVSKCISNARKAQKLALSALKNRIEANTIAAVRVPREENPTRKAKLRQRVKAMKTKASADVKTAKQLLREGTAAMKAAGLSALSSPLKVSDISLTSEPGRSARTVKAAQTDSLVIKGKKGYIKPKFLAASKFEALGQKSSTAKPVAEPRAAVKRVQKSKADKSPSKKSKGEGISGHGPKDNLYFAKPAVKAMIAKYAAKPDADLSKMSLKELRSASESFDKKADRAASAHRRSTGSGAGAYDKVRDAHKRVRAEIERRKG